MKQFFFYCLILSSVISARIGYAQEEAEFKKLLQEFNFGQPVYPQENKELQFTAGSFLQTPSENHDLDLSFGFEYGFTDRLQFEAELSDYIVGKPEINNRRKNNYQLSTGILYNVVNNQGFSSSLVMELGVPVQNGPETLSLQYEPHLLLAKQVGKGQVHLDAGAEIQQGDKEYLYDLIFIYPLNGLKPLLELNGSYEDEPDLYISPGLVWNNSRNFEVVTGATFGLWERKGSWGLSFKVIYEISFEK